MKALKAQRAVHERIEEAVEKLRARGVRMTPQRYAILAYMLKTRAHPTADEIYKALSPDFPSMSVATVYNNLKLFKEAGLVRELTFGDQASRFDGQVHEHYHAVCVVCGRIDDFEYTPLKFVEREAARLTGYTPLEHRMEIYGVCPNCQLKRATETSGDVHAAAGR
ncbi:MAG: transcriptional repressor [Hydrogenibacillus sp.]|nr:transcriptional repressor [Hydrogenibacillus sp.]